MRLLKHAARLLIIFYAVLLFVALAEDALIWAGVWIHEEWEKRL